MVAKPKRRVLYIQAGTGNAFLRELGKISPNHAKTAIGQTCAALVVIENSRRHGDRIVAVLVFDTGAGITDCLIDFGISKITHLLLSHNHPDHWLSDLDRLVQTHLRSNGRETADGDPIRIPFYCTEPTWSAGPGKLLDYLPLSPTYVTPGVGFRPGTYSAAGVSDGDGFGIDLSITPVRVYHGNRSIVPDPVVWVVEFGSAGARSKLVLCWDLLHLVPRYSGEDADELFTGPVFDSDVTELQPEHRILFKPDYLIIAGNTFYPAPATGHTCIEKILSFYVPALRPKVATLVSHVSCAEDPMGPVSDFQLQMMIDDAKLDFGLGAGDRILLAQPRMCLSFPA